LPEETTEDELLSLIDVLNDLKCINGILVQLPLPKHIDESKVLERIVPEKDVDGFTAINTGKLWQGEYTIAPCTAMGIIELLDYYNIEIAGKHCVIVGRSNIVGKPLAALLLERDATVTVCHSKTKSLSEITNKADILISAVGKPKFITWGFVKKDAIVIDVGINRDENGKLCGDVDAENVANKVSLLTPVPGGVGPMTVAMLMKNTLTTAKDQY
jgi:methylenetetrahydrofolate dehydrogenase (NADP+)/methenyltetrahydrofolate cyclohydrolase